ncbi:MAG TPA: pitrilysin family protein [Candidatus Limnocylindrales bacterium]|nr:pitrilysin family protein [Candidatus Limnocylindrales bacterium]
MNTTMKRLCLLAIATPVLGISPALAQKQAPPEGGPPKAFTVPANETYTLPNGMKVTLVPYGIIPKAEISLAVDAGEINEGTGRIGVASLTTDLMKEGTEKLTAQQVAEAAARMGSTLEIHAGKDQTKLGIDVLQEFAPDAVELLADVAQHPRFPQSEIDRLKNDALRQIALQNSQPQTIAVVRFRKILYGDHPYSIVVPAEADIKKLTLQDVKDFYAGNFGAQRAHLYIAGKFDAAAVKKAIAESFSSWGKGAARVENVPVLKPQHVLDVSDRPGAPQSVVMTGLPVPPATGADTVPLIVTNALLGGSFNSRITANIREDKGYSYSPRSELSRRYHDGYWAETAEVTTQFTGPSLKEIFAEVTRLQKEPASEVELKGIQNYLSGVFVIQNSNRGALIGQLQNVDFQGLGENYLKTYVAKVNAVTPAVVQKMTQDYIKPEEMTIVVVGDKAKITDQLTAFQPSK